MSKQTITVIIPVHELNDSTKEGFKKAVDSVNKQRVKADKLMVVAPKKVAEQVNEILGEMESMAVDIVINKGATDFSSQLNLGVEKLQTTHFAMLEYDDELSPIWLDNVHKYMKYHSDVDIFLPIIVDMDEGGKFIGFTNEPVWANEFSEEMGKIDNATLLRYNNFSFDGMVMSKEKYEAFGGLKPSMKLTFPYEFLLRVTNFAGTVMVIPKFGYKHTAGREGSLFDSYKEFMELDERRWWLATAKKEYFHTNDRKITYEKE